MRTILVTAYAINPYKGSEDGAGWNNILQIAKNNKVVAITRKNNIPDIQRYISENQLSSINAEFYGFDLPKWSIFWKRGQNGAMLYFYLWQRFVVSFVKKNKIEFDIAHNLNFHTDWVPTFLWKLKKPTVWGPVGHHPKVPSGYYHQENSSLFDRLKNQVIWLIKNVFWKLDPNFEQARKNVDHVICMNSEAENMLHLPKEKVSRCASVGSKPVSASNGTKEKFTILSVGRLVPLKGFDITIKSFHEFLKMLPESRRANVELVIIGKGKLQKYLEDYIKENSLENNVKLINWMDRDNLLKFYEKTSLFFFPSHEGAGMVVLEALSFGVPILCFDNSGPGEFIGNNAGVKVPYTSYNRSIIDFALELNNLHFDREFLNELSEGALKRFENCFKWDVHGDLFEKVYDRINTVA